MSVTTRHDPHRARAGSGRRTPTKAGSTRTAQRSKKASAQTARPVRTTRPLRPVRSQPTTPRRRPAASKSASTRARPRPHQPRAQVTRLPVSRPRRAWAGGTFQRRIRLVRLVLVAAMLLLVARLVDVQVLHAGAYQTAARGESSITVSLPSLRGGSMPGTAHPWRCPCRPTTWSPTISRSLIPCRRPWRSRRSSTSRPRRSPPNCAAPRATWSWPVSCPSRSRRRYRRTPFPASR